MYRGPAVWAMSSRSLTLNCCVVGGQPCGQDSRGVHRSRRIKGSFSEVPASLPLGLSFCLYLCQLLYSSLYCLCLSIPLCFCASFFISQPPALCSALFPSFSISLSLFPALCVSLPLIPKLSYFFIFVSLYSIPRPLFV